MAETRIIVVESPRTASSVESCLNESDEELGSMDIACGAGLSNVRPANRDAGKGIKATSAGAWSDHTDLSLEQGYPIMRKSSLDHPSRNIYQRIRDMTVIAKNKYYVAPTLASDAEQLAKGYEISPLRMKKVDVASKSQAVSDPEVVIHDPGSLDPINGKPREHPILDHLKQVSDYCRTQTENLHTKMNLLVHVISAIKLAKPDRYGTQSSFLEVKICDSSHLTSNLMSCASVDHTLSLRTQLHKKGGSEAQWDRTFSLAIQSSTFQVLHVAARNGNRNLIGETHISIKNVSNVDQEAWHSLYMKMEGSQSDIETGRVHLRLRFMTNAENDIILSDVPPSQQANASTNDIDVDYDIRHGVPSILFQGQLFYKVQYHQNIFGLFSSASPSTGMYSAPKRQWLAVKLDYGRRKERVILWGDPQGNCESNVLRLDQVQEIRIGHDTLTFHRFIKQIRAALSTSSNVGSAAAVYTMVREEDRCFSIIATSRTLDLIASSRDEVKIWVLGLRALLSERSSDEASSDDSVCIPSQAASTIEKVARPASVERVGTARVPEIAIVSSKSKAREVLEAAIQQDFKRLNAIFQELAIDTIVSEENGDTLLLWACRVGDLRLVELCLKYRARNDPHPDYGDTAIQVAVKNRHAQCLSRLLSIAAQSQMDGEIVNHIDSCSDAPLHVAATAGDLACLQILCHHGADVAVVDLHGRTPVYCAVQGNHYDCVAYLLDVGSDTILNEGDNNMRNTPLHIAAKMGHIRVAELLLQSAADASALNLHGKLPSQLAIQQGHPECAKLIARYLNQRSAVKVYDAYSKSEDNLRQSGNSLIRHKHFGSRRRILNPYVSTCPTSSSDASDIPSPRLHIRKALARNPKLIDVIASRYGGEARNIRSRPWQSARDPYSASGIDSTQHCLTERGYYRNSSFDRLSTASTHIQDSSQLYKLHMSRALQVSDVADRSLHDRSQEPQDQTQWDTYYTEEGYPYFVNRVSGISQWENPYEAVPLSADVALRRQLEIARSKNRTAQTADVTQAFAARNGPSMFSFATSNPVSKAHVQPFPCVTAVDLPVHATERSTTTLLSTVSRTFIIDPIRVDAITKALSAASVQDRDIHDTIIAAISLLDVNQPSVQLQILRCLLEYYPKQEEEALAGFTEEITDLHDTEKFFVKLFKIPHTLLHIKTLTFMMEFPQEVKKVMQMLQILRRACRDLVENFAFQRSVDTFFARAHLNQPRIDEAIQTNRIERSLSHLQKHRTKYIQYLIGEGAHVKLASFRTDLKDAACLQEEQLSHQYQLLNENFHQASKLERKLNTIIDSEAALDKHDRDTLIRAKSASHSLRTCLALFQPEMMEMIATYQSFSIAKEQLLRFFGERQETCPSTSIFELILDILQEIGTGSAKETVD